MRKSRFFCLLLALLLMLVGCTGGDPLPTDGVTTTASPAPQSPAPQEPLPQEPSKVSETYRILISSDLHCTDLREYHGTDYATRMQHWVDSVLEEHRREPIDLIVINGDVSLDHCEGGGAILLHREITTKTFVDQYLSQLPKEIDVFLMPGNHEQQSQTQWYLATGNLRQGYRVLGNNLLILLDNYNMDLNPLVNSNGTYSGTDISYVEGLMDEYPTHNVYLISHYFDVEKEGFSLCALLAQNERIIGLFQGHTHRASVITLGKLYRNLTIAQTGNFSYSNPEEANAFWGFRELVITEDSAYSRYIVVSSRDVLETAPLPDRRIMLPVCYYGTMPKD